MSDEIFMKRAIELAHKAQSLQEVPIGAVVVHNNQIIAEAHNQRETQNSPTAHAEILALEQASKKLGQWRLLGCTLYVTLEPCVMCAGAAVLARVDRVVYGAKDPKAGAVESLYQILSDPRLNHRPQITSQVLEAECSQLLKDFFAKKRKPLPKPESESE